MAKLIAFLAAICLLLFIAIVLSRSRRQPNPFYQWLPFSLQNACLACLDCVAGASVLIDRLGLEPGMHVLDVGCGPGRLTIPFAKHIGRQGQVAAFDVDERMLQALRDRLRSNHLDNVEIVLGRAGEGELDWENIFDRAVMVTALGEIPEKKKALQEVLRALKPGGILSVTEVLPDPDYQRASTVVRLAEDAGFEMQGRHGNVVAFTLNFRKPGVQPSAAPDAGDAPRVRGDLGIPYLP